MQQGKIEFIVGVFTIIGLVLLSILVFSMRDMYFYKKGYEINVVFNYISILDKGAPVRMSGVRVGEVKRVNVAYEEKTQKPVITITLFINSSAIIREKTQIAIRGTTPMSEPHVEITSNGLVDGAQLESGSTIRGIDPIPMEQLLITANEVIERVRQIVIRASGFFEDKEIADAVKGILLNTNTLTLSLNQIVAGQKGNLSSAIESIERSTKNLDGILQQMKEGKGTAGKVFVDEELYNELLSFVKDLKAHPWKLLAKPKPEKKGFHLF